MYDAPPHGGFSWPCIFRNYVKYISIGPLPGLIRMSHSARPNENPLNIHKLLKNPAYD